MANAIRVLFLKHIVLVNRSLGEKTLFTTRYVIQISGPNTFETRRGL